MQEQNDTSMIDEKGVRLLSKTACDHDTKTVL